ncbi:M48 family metallopeptidase [Haloarchaeobius sp. DFWS5]|uniref:M48 family metallopeptidase n=1 Tax=Haloarchaeobius sp. DFWS5 TaxID=3446114 RepID=UPI003EBAB74F
MQSRGLGIRLLLALAGVVLFAAYLLVGAAAVSFVVAVWTRGVDPFVFVGSLVVTSLLFGYLSYRGGTTQLLASLDATELPRERAPQLYSRIDQLCETMRVDTPRVLVAKMATPNALAIGGRDGGVVVLSVSLFRLLSSVELETIVAHELAHLESRDSLVQTLGFSLAQTATGFVFVCLFPLGLFVAGLRRAFRRMTGRRTEPFVRHLRRTHAQVASVVVIVMLGLTLALRAHSRRREIAADERAAAVTGKPMSLARALARIERASEPPGGLLSSLYIHGQEEDSLSQLLATHPPMSERIQRLVDRAESEWQRIEIQ